MRCEECRSLVEQYFDGELERRKGEQVAAHTAACEDCAAALDALAFEQEMYLRYDRQLEVSPALWENVRAGVARLEAPAPAARPLTPLARLRGLTATAFGAFAPRAAFAPALALILLAAFVGALWLARRPGPAGDLAQQRPATPNVGENRAPVAAAPPVAPTVIDGGGQVEGDKRVETVDVAPAPTLTRADAGASLVNAGGVKTPAPGERRPGRDALTPPPAPNHLEAAEAELLVSAPPAELEVSDVTVATASTRLLTPEEKEMARHLEQAQMLLRSFQNEAATGGDAVQVAYERRLSRKLLAENESLRLEADVAGNKQTRQVLDSLEPFLLDIANLRDNASRDEVRSIKERMQKKEIIAALHVY